MAQRATQAIVWTILKHVFDTFEVFCLITSLDMGKPL